MFKAWIDFIVSVFKALLKLTRASANEQQKIDEHKIQEEELKTHQENLQNQYNKIDEEYKIDPNPTLQDVEEKLNDRF